MTSGSPRLVETARMRTVAERKLRVRGSPGETLEDSRQFYQQAPQPQNVHVTRSLQRQLPLF